MIESGTLMVKMRCQPPRPIRSPPRVGPITAITWFAIERLLRITAGVSIPVRSASLRIKDIAAGYAAEVPKPRRTREPISTPRFGASAPSRPAMPTSEVANR
ncbi:hypothetical protein PWY87_11785 [Kribbella solani]|nr:hypothetical protein [Kribbella solani]MDX3002356.1 hypothetical protein [Kribbella solani]